MCYNNKKELDLIEQLSIECHKTETKVITLANQKGHRQSNEPITTQLTQSARKRVRASRTSLLGLALQFFTSDWIKKWRELFLHQSQNQVRLDTRLETALALMDEVQAGAHYWEPTTPI